MPKVTTLKQVLRDEAEPTYVITEKLFKKLTNNDLNWKPSTGKNWMTLGQLLMHCAKFGCGESLKGFITGDWGMPESTGEAPPPESTLPPAEALPTVESIEQALTLLEEDKKLALKLIEDLDESTLLTKRLAAPWGGPELTLFQQLEMMIMHLIQHKGQLFYYLKLMGKDVSTGDLWGM
jgi:hypothetical protein